MECNIVISEQNRQKINDFINEVEGRCTMRTITYDSVVQACEKIEKKLGIYKKDMEYVKFNVDIHAQNFPNAYKYRAESTHFIVERRGGKWRLVAVGRNYTRTYGHEFKCEYMTEQTKNAIIQSMMDF
jgi:hypothetical protein